MSTLSERLAAAAAATSGAAAAAAVTGKTTTGMANSATMQAANAAAISAAKAEVAALTKPVRTSTDEVLFKTSRLNLGSATPEGIRFRFENGWLLTNNAKLIDFIRNNAERWEVSEDKTLPVTKKLAASGGA